PAHVAVVALGERRIDLERRAGRRAERLGRLERPGQVARNDARDAGAGEAPGEARGLLATPGAEGRPGQLDHAGRIAVGLGVTQEVDGHAAPQTTPGSPAEATLASGRARDSDPALRAAGGARRPGRRRPRGTRGD